MITTAQPHEVLGEALESAWKRSDAIFDTLEPGAFGERPIPLRHPFLFYLGHLPAFAWNHLGVAQLGREHVDAAFEDLFERGIDPPTDGSAPDPAAERWPEREAVEAYRDRVRAALRAALPELAARDAATGERGGEQLLHAVLEHELMHHETLMYMVQALDPALKRAPAGTLGPSDAPAAQPERVEIPAGPTRLGADPDSQPFGWDNEFPAQELHVPAFRMDSVPVMNGQYLEFVEAGGYDTPRFWSSEAWRWREREGLRHPLGWRRDGNQWYQRTAFGEQPLERVFDWPVSVSWAEAEAYARWKGRRLPTEAEFHRAAYATPGEQDREHPWGRGPSDEESANAHFRQWSPVPVGSCPGGRSAFGVHELVGNGWEWTSTRFGPLPGFRVTLPSYAGYSSDFFDEPHYVMLGGSWATDERLLRRSFRNWFRPHYPWAFTKFRLVDDAAR